MPDLSLVEGISDPFLRGLKEDLEENLGVSVELGSGEQVGSCGCPEVPGRIHSQGGETTSNRADYLPDEGVPRQLWG